MSASVSWVPTSISILSNASTTRCTPVNDRTAPIRRTAAVTRGAVMAECKLGSMAAADEFCGLVKVVVGGGAGCGNNFVATGTARDFLPGP